MPNKASVQMFAGFILVNIQENKIRDLFKIS